MINGQGVCSRTNVLDLYIRLRYIYSIATVTVWVLHGGCFIMDYKKEIIEMVRKINCEKILKLIYGFVKRGYKEEMAGR